MSKLTERMYGFSDVEELLPVFYVRWTLQKMDLSFVILFQYNEYHLIQHSHEIPAGNGINKMEILIVILHNYPC